MANAINIETLDYCRCGHRRASECPGLLGRGCLAGHHATVLRVPGGETSTAAPRPAMKIPKYLTKPVNNWTEFYGMRRAIAVLRTEAAVLNKQGLKLQAAALRTMATALQRAIAKPFAEAEADTLDWVARLENPQGDFKTPKPTQGAK